MDTRTSQNIVKTLSIIGFIHAGLMFIIGIALLFSVISPQDAALNPPTFEDGQPLLTGSSLYTVVGLFVLVLALLFFLIAWNLWNYKNWARILLIILALLGLIQGIATLAESIAAGIIAIIVYVIVIYLVGFDKDVVALFKPAKPVAASKKASRPAARKNARKSRAKKK